MISSDDPGGHRIDERRGDGAAPDSIGPELDASASAVHSLSLEFLRHVARGTVSDPAPAREPVAEPDLGPLASRFDIERRLGAGGFGVVYQVRDRQLGATVALKLLARRSGRALYRFKREFRALAGLDHPNLVRLHELHGGASPWFFTMELLRGVDALASVRPPDRDGPALDVARLRSVFTQLVEGLRFFHDTGRVHCDVKPSNVVVEPGGRVVLVDFGLAVEMGDPEPDVLLGCAGTPRYMAPEQLAHGPLGPATDWYAVGVMLAQCLTGRLPPAGGPLPALAGRDAAPAGLHALAEALLRPDPAERPQADEILSRLGSDGPPALRRGVRAPGPRGGSFVGRARELAMLDGAFASASAGRVVVALVHGPSRAGRSTLLQRFRQKLRASQPAAVVLASRCFEHEALPFHAVDGLVDAAGTVLLEMGEVEARAVLPPDAAALAALFPSLRRVPALADGGGEDRDARPPASAVRSRAFAALRELLARLAARGPLAILIDDMHRGDAATAAVLSELLCGAGAPPMLAVLAFRDDGEDRGDCLRTLLPALEAHLGAGGALIEIPVAELPSREVLARGL